MHANGGQLEAVNDPKNGLIKKLRLIAKCMMSQTRQQIIPINILSNISRSKDNRAMKFGQLMDYNMKNTFLEKSYAKCGGKGSPRPLKNSKLRIPLDQQFEILYRLYYCMSKLMTTKIY